MGLEELMVCEGIRTVWEVREGNITLQATGGVWLSEGPHQGK